MPEMLASLASDYPSATAFLAALALPVDILPNRAPREVRCRGRRKVSRTGTRTITDLPQSRAMRSGPVLDPEAASRSAAWSERVEGIAPVEAPAVRSVVRCKEHPVAPEL